MVTVDTFLKELVRLDGSDLHLQTGEIPKVRVEGNLKNLQYVPLSRDWLEQLVPTMITNPVHLGRYHDNFSTDFSYYSPDIGYFRTNICKCLSGIKVTMRNLNRPILPLSDLGFNEDIFKPILNTKKGFCLITGSTNSGKSTTLASLLQELATQGRNIVTLEDPIEFIIKSNKSIVTQREYGSHFLNFQTAIADGLRMDPNVFLLGEMRDPQTIKSALLLAETGHLVLATLHTPTIDEAVNRMLLQLSTEDRNQLKPLINKILDLVVSQELVFDETTQKLKLKYEYKYFREV